MKFLFKKTDAIFKKPAYISTLKSGRFTPYFSKISVCIDVLGLSFYHEYTLGDLLHMIEKNIPQDITKYETKLIGPFTLRQAVFIIPALGAGIGTYFLVRNALGESAIPVAMLACLPFVLFGFVKIYGMPFEKYLKAVFISRFVAPTHRLFKTENTWKEMEKAIIANENKKKKKKPTTVKTAEKKETKIETETAEEAGTSEDKGE